MATIYLNHFFYDDFEETPFGNIIINYLINDSSKKIIIFVKERNITPSQKLYFEKLEKEISEERFSADNIVIVKDLNKAINYINQGFNTFFAIDDSIIFSADLFSYFDNRIEFHYSTTSNCLTRTIINALTDKNKFIIDFNVFIDPLHSKYLGIILKEQRKFFERLSEVNIQKQPFYSKSTYLLYSKNKGVQKLDSKTNGISPIDNSQLLDKGELDNLRHSALFSKSETENRDEWSVLYDDGLPF